MKYSIKQFRSEFPTDDSCLEYIFIEKHPDLVGKYWRVTGRKCYANSRGEQLHPLAGTIFEKSDTPLTLWFYAIYLFSSSKNGVSAKELERQLGVTYKCAWRIAKQIRSLMGHDGGKLSGFVEMDETYIGGRKKAHIKRRGSVGKVPVVGMVEREGRVIAEKTDDASRWTLESKIKEHIEPESDLFTDDWAGYNKVSRLGLSHSVINHSKEKYVRGEVHTNTIEGFWSQMKRSIDGTYHAVSPKHLQGYVDEFAWRYNHRRIPCSLFRELIARV